MTFHALNLRVFAQQWKLNEIMIKTCYVPRCLAMAGCTLLTKLTFMLIIFTMTAVTVIWCVLIDIIVMTCSAFHILMLALQRVARIGMVKLLFFPVTFTMATLTICSEPALVNIIFPVTGITVLRCFFILVVDMAGLTFNRGV